MKDGKKYQIVVSTFKFSAKKFIDISMKESARYLFSD